MRKIRLLSMVLLMSVILCSCTGIKGFSDKKKTMSEAQRIEAMSEDIIRCLTEKDKEAFTELFCEQVKSTEGFSEQVDQLFAFFQCDTYLTADINTSSSGGGSYEDGKKTEWSVTPAIPYIQVLLESDDGNMKERYYGVSYYWQIIDEKDSSEEGLHNIKVNLLNTEDTVFVGE